MKLLLQVSQLKIQFVINPCSDIIDPKMYKQQIEKNQPQKITVILYVQIMLAYNATNLCTLTIETNIFNLNEHSIK